MNPKRLDEANRAIAAALRVYHKPAIACSFGKDSMVLLHLVLKQGKLPVVFYTDPWFPKKYAFARSIIEKYELEVYDYAPMSIGLWEGGGVVAFNNRYDVGNGAYIDLPKNIVEPTGKGKWLCAISDVLMRPTSNFAFPFDALLVGHKGSDSDQIAGKIELHCDVKLNYLIGPDAIFPLRNWSDDDVWDYTEENNVEVQADRYQERKELEDKTTNSDYAEVCIACCDRRNPVKSVKCPKYGFEINSLLHNVPYHEIKHSYYSASSKDKS